MNKKKLLMFAIPIMAITLVTALVVLNFNVLVNTNQSVFIDGETSITCQAGETCVGDAITITNNASVDGNLKLVETELSEPGECDDTEIGYIGKMHFVTKDSSWNTITGSTADVEYTITGEDFVVNEIPEGYELIYYPNLGTFEENVAGILVYDIDEFPSLPIAEDIGDNYCSNGFNPSAEVCNGAKLWLVDSDFVDDLKTGSWDISKIMFETDLVTYTKGTEGQILVPANSTITFYPTTTSNILSNTSTCEFEVKLENQ